MPLEILWDIIQAHIRLEEEQFDYDMSLLAWQTSLLMNSTGNYKKKIKPDDLYTPMRSMEDESSNRAGKKLAEEEVEQLRNELLEKFANSI